MMLTVKVPHGKRLANRAVIAMIGDISREEAQAIALELTRRLPQGEPLPELPAVAKPVGVEERIPHAASQAHILIGAPTLARSDPDFFALTVGNYILGGGGFVSALVTVAAVVVSVVYPPLAVPAFAAAGAINGSVKGGDAVWRGALIGGAGGLINTGIAQNAGMLPDWMQNPIVRNAVTGAALTSAMGGNALKGVEAGAITGLLSPMVSNGYNHLLKCQMQVQE